MTTKQLVTAAVVGAGMLCGSLLAQSDSKGAMKGKMAQMKQKMQAQTKGPVGQAEMSRHREITQLVDRLSQTFAAIQPNEEPAALRQKLAAHQAVLKELQEKIAEHGKMMGQATTPAPAEPAAPADPHANHP